jgi:hypothetical protein
LNAVYDVMSPGLNLAVLVLTVSRVSPS